MPDEALKEVVATLRPLVQSEETRSSNFNVRAAAVFSASSIVTTILGFFVKDLYTDSFKTFSERFEWLIVALTVAALLALLATVGCCLAVLLPKTRFAYSLAHIKAWAGENPQIDAPGDSLAPVGNIPGVDQILRRSVHELGWIYARYRPINNRKANWLERAYISLGTAITLVVLTASAVALYTGATEPQSAPQKVEVVKLP